MSAGRRSIDLALALTVGLAAGAALAAEVEVTQKNRAFSAKQIALRAGDMLVMHNEDTRAHNIQVSHPKLTYNSGLQEPGEDATEDGSPSRPRGGGRRCRWGAGIVSRHARSDGLTGMCRKPDRTA